MFPCVTFGAATNPTRQKVLGSPLNGMSPKKSTGPADPGSPPSKVKTNQVRPGAIAGSLERMTTPVMLAWGTVGLGMGKKTLVQRTSILRVPVGRSTLTWPKPFSGVVGSASAWAENSNSVKPQTGRTYPSPVARNRSN
jgi:hypothetical protein